MSPPTGAGVGERVVGVVAGVGERVVGVVAGVGVAFEVEIGEG